MTNFIAIDLGAESGRVLFPVVEELEHLQPVPELEEATFIVSGSGQRLREIITEPAANLTCIVANKGGLTGQLHTSHQQRFEIKQSIS